VPAFDRDAVASAGQIRFQDGKWHTTDEPFIDTRTDQQRSRQLRAYWLRRAAQAVEGGTPGTFGYSLFSVSERDLEKVRQVHLRYYREITELIAASEPSERVVLFAAQLYELDHPTDHAL